MGRIATQRQNFSPRVQIYLHCPDPPCLTVVTNQVFSGPEKKEFWAPVKEVKEKKTLRKGKEREDNISKIKRNKRKERKENVKQAIGKGKRKESWSELNGNYSVDKQP